MKKIIIGFFVLAFAVVSGIYIFFPSIFGLSIKPAWEPAPKDITKYLPDDSVPEGAVNETNLLLKLPSGFRISIFEKKLPDARVLARDSSGNIWVSRTARGSVAKLTLENGNVSATEDIFVGLRKPHGLAFDPNDPDTLYIGEEHRVSKFDVRERRFIEKIADLPSGGGHFTRTIGFGPDGMLYISVGSSCNVCVELDDRRATILVYDQSLKKASVFAKGLRNAVFFNWNTAWASMDKFKNINFTPELWATEMGRDWLGDNTPPDEIDIIRKGGNYGWPNCYGKNIHDTNFDKKTYIRKPCMEPFETPSFVDFPAHSAPLGITFIPKGQWPEDYWYDALVSLHGSWNRSEPTGYKVVRLKFDSEGNYQGTEDFITGWLTPEGSLGRPVDIMFDPQGAMYLSDDKAGIIYKITPLQK